MPRSSERLGHLVTHVQAIGEFAAEDRDDLGLFVRLDFVLSTQLGPVDVLLVTTRHSDDERTDPRPLADHVGRRQRRLEIQPIVDLIE